MWSPFRIFRIDKETDDARMESIRDIIASARDALRLPFADTFLGRKTHEPFPAEGDPLERADVQNLIRSELQPPK